MSFRLHNEDMPCSKNCESRKVGCHAACSEYAKWSAHRAEVYKEREEFRQREYDIKKTRKRHVG